MAKRAVAKSSGSGEMTAAVRVVILHGPDRFRQDQAIQEPYTPDYDEPGGMGFGVRDREGNIWSFGTYGMGQT